MHWVRGKKSGFTLLELTITVFLVVSMLTLSSVFYRNANKRTQTILTAQLVASNLRLAESYAASAKEFNNNPANNVWGVYFNKNQADQYIIFVDLNNNLLYDANENYRLVKLPRDIIIYELTYKNRSMTTPAAVDDLSITWSPPDPKVAICRSGQTCYQPNGTPPVDNRFDEGFILLRDEFNVSTKKIGVNFFGLVDVIF